MKIAVAATVLLMAAAASAQEAKKFPAVLAGHAILPAMTLVEAPPDAPESLKISGKYTAPDLRRRDAIASIEGRSGSGPGARATGISLPFNGQPVQGFSGIKSAGNGEFWSFSDNGFGNRLNSPDAMLMVHRLRIDFSGGKVERLETVFLHDPDRKVPFHIVNEGTAKRYLTGSDFDIEGMQPIGDAFWIGDEFGPYLLRADRTGEVTHVFETRLGGKVLKWPDHHTVAAPATPDGKPAFQVRRSKGYEGLAQSPDGTKLYGLLEGPIWDEGGGRLGERRRPPVSAHPRVRRRYPRMVGPFREISARRQRELDRRFQHDRRAVWAHHRARRWGGDLGARLPRRRPARLLRLAGKVQAHLSHRSGRVREQLDRPQDRLHRPHGHRRSGAQGAGRRRRRQVQLPLLHDRERRPRRRRAHRRRQRQQPAVLGRTGLDKADNNEFILLRVPELLAAQ